MSRAAIARRCRAAAEPWAAGHLFRTRTHRRMVVTLSSMRFLAPILVGLALAHAELCGAQAVDPKPSTAAPAQIVPEDTTPGRSGSSQEPLGKKLDQTDGVIHPPPGVDPGLTISPPHAQGTMAVIWTPRYTWWRTRLTAKTAVILKLLSLREPAGGCVPFGAAISALPFLLA